MSCLLHFEINFRSSTTKYTIKITPFNNTGILSNSYTEYYCTIASSNSIYVHMYIIYININFRLERHCTHAQRQPVRNQKTVVCLLT